MNAMDPAKCDRMQLIYRVQAAYEELRSTMHDPSRSGKALVAARRRLSLLNRALAVAALQAAS